MGRADDGGVGMNGGSLSRKAAGQRHAGSAPKWAAGCSLSEIHYSITSTVKHAKLSRFYVDLYLY